VAAVVRQDPPRGGFWPGERRRLSGRGSSMGGDADLCARSRAGSGRPSMRSLNTCEYDVMITETPYPATVSPNTQLLVRYHDAFPLLMPHTIADPEFQHAIHYLTLRHNVSSGAWFVCISEATRRDLLAIFPQAEARSLTIHNIVPDHYFDEDSHPDRVRGNHSCSSRRAGRAGSLTGPSRYSTC
jgi:hypothetical protein